MQSLPQTNGMIQLNGLITTELGIFQSELGILFCWLGFESFFYPLNLHFGSSASYNEEKHVANRFWYQIHPCDSLEASCFPPGAIRIQQPTHFLSIKTSPQLTRRARSDIFQIRQIRFTCPSGVEPTEGVWNIHSKCDWTYILFITSRADQSGRFLSFSRGFLLVGGDTGRATKLFLKPLRSEAKTSFRPRKAFAVVLCSTFSCEDAL